MKDQNKQSNEEISLYKKRFEKLKLDYRTSDWDNKRKLKSMEILGVFNLSGKIMDFGCGTATYTHYLNRSYEEVVGVDISPSNIDIAKNVDDQSKYICADGLNLPFEDGHFDAVFVGQVLHHFLDLKDPLYEINRVLSDDGHLFIIEPNDWNPAVSLKYRKRFFKRNKQSYEKHHAIGFLDIRKKLDLTGFKVVKRQGVNFYPAQSTSTISKFIKNIEPYIESTPLHFLGGSLLITARKYENATKKH